MFKILENLYNNYINRYFESLFLKWEMIFNALSRNFWWKLLVCHSCSKAAGYMLEATKNQRMTEWIHFWECYAVL